MDEIKITRGMISEGVFALRQKCPLDVAFPVGGEEGAVEEVLKAALAVRPDIPTAETRLWELADGLTLAVQVAPDGAAYFAVPPSVQAQLDRIEAMLAKAFEPKKETREPPDFTWMHNYLREAEPGCGLSSLVDVDDGSYIVKSRAEISRDTQDWIRAQFDGEIRFEVVS